MRGCCVFIHFGWVNLFVLAANAIFWSKIFDHCENINTEDKPLEVKNAIVWPEMNKAVKVLKMKPGFKQ